MNTITHTRYGSFCDACGAALGQEEIDFECCGCCGGEGFGGDEDDDFDWSGHDDREDRRDG